MAEPIHPARKIIDAWNGGDRTPVTLHALADTLEEHDQNGLPHVRKLAGRLRRAARRIESGQDTNTDQGSEAHRQVWNANNVTIGYRPIYEDEDRGITVHHHPGQERWNIPPRWVVETRVPESYKVREQERGRGRDRFDRRNSGSQQQAFYSEEEAMAHVREVTRPGLEEQGGNPNPSMRSRAAKPTGKLGKPKKVQGFKKKKPSSRGKEGHLPSHEPEGREMSSEKPIRRAKKTLPPSTLWTGRKRLEAPQLSQRSFFKGLPGMENHPKTPGTVVHQSGNYQVVYDPTFTHPETRHHYENGPLPLNWDHGPYHLHQEYGSEHPNTTWRSSHPHLEGALQSLSGRQEAREAGENLSQGESPDESARPVPNLDNTHEPETGEHNLKGLPGVEEHPRIPGTVVHHQHNFQVVYDPTWIHSSLERHQTPPGQEPDRYEHGAYHVHEGGYDPKRPNRTWQGSHPGLEGALQEISLRRETREQFQPGQQGMHGLKSLSPKQTAAHMIRVVLHGEPKESAEAWGPMLDSLSDAGVEQHHIDYLRENYPRREGIRRIVLSELHNQLEGRHSDASYVVHHGQHYRVLYDPNSEGGTQRTPYYITHGTIGHVRSQHQTLQEAREHIQRMEGTPHPEGEKSLSAQTKALDLKQVAAHTAFAYLHHGDTHPATVHALADLWEELGKNPLFAQHLHQLAEDSEHEDAQRATREAINTAHAHLTDRSPGDDYEVHRGQHYHVIHNPAAAHGLYLPVFRFSHPSYRIHSNHTGGFQEAADTFSLAKQRAEEMDQQTEALHQQDRQEEGEKSLQSYPRKAHDPEVSMRHLAEACLHYGDKVAPHVLADLLEEHDSGDGNRRLVARHLRDHIEAGDQDQLRRTVNGIHAGLTGRQIHEPYEVHHGRHLHIVYDPTTAGSDGQPGWPYHIMRGERNHSAHRSLQGAQVILNQLEESNPEPQGDKSLPVPPRIHSKGSSIAQEERSGGNPTRRMISGYPPACAILDDSRGVRESPMLVSGKSLHQYSSTQFNLDTAGYSRSQGSPLSKLKELQDAIPDVDLTGDGREKEIHVTVLYGLHTQDSSEVEQCIRNWLRTREGKQGGASVSATLGKVSLFPAGEGGDDYDVVKVEVDSPDLYSLHEFLAKNLEHTDTHPDYNPHVTLAYVKPGCGEKYTGVGLDRHEVILHHLMFSDKDGRKTIINLWNAGRGQKALPNHPGEQFAREYRHEGKFDRDNLLMLADTLEEHGPEHLAEPLRRHAREGNETEAYRTVRAAHEWMKSPETIVHHEAPFLIVHHPQRGYYLNNTEAGGVTDPHGHTFYHRTVQNALMHLRRLKKRQEGQKALSYLDSTTGGALVGANLPKKRKKESSLLSGSKALIPRQFAAHMLHTTIHEDPEALGPTLDVLEEHGLADPNEISQLRQESSLPLLHRIHARLEGRRSEHEPYEVHRSEHHHVMYHPSGSGNRYDIVGNVAPGFDRGLGVWLGSRPTLTEARQRVHEIEHPNEDVKSLRAFYKAKEGSYRHGRINNIRSRLPVSDRRRGGRSLESLGFTKAHPGAVHAARQYLDTQDPIHLNALRDMLEESEHPHEREMGRRLRRVTTGQGKFVQHGTIPQEVQDIHYHLSGMTPEEAPVGTTIHRASRHFVRKTAEGYTVFAPSRVEVGRGLVGRPAPSHDYARPEEAIRDVNELHQMDQEWIAHQQDREKRGDRRSGSFPDVNFELGIYAVRGRPTQRSPLPKPPRLNHPQAGQGIHRKSLLFVYGTLKQGGQYHNLLQDARLLGSTNTSPGYKEGLEGSYPVLEEGESESTVRGEVYEVSPQTLHSLLSEEDHYELRPVQLQGVKQPVQAFFFKPGSTRDFLGKAFTGKKQDARGRQECYQDGIHVPCQDDQGRGDQEEASPLPEQDPEGELVSEREEELEQRAFQRMRDVLNAARELPTRLVPERLRVIAGKIKDKAVQLLKNRYGDRATGLILKAAVLSAPVPLPGSQPITIVASLVIAEAVRAYQKLTGGQGEKSLEWTDIGGRWTTETESGAYHIYPALRGGHRLAFYPKREDGRIIVPVEADIGVSTEEEGREGINKLRQLAEQHHGPKAEPGTVPDWNREGWHPGVPRVNPTDQKALKWRRRAGALGYVTPRFIRTGHGLYEVNRTNSGFRLRYTPHGSDHDITFERTIPEEGNLDDFLPIVEAHHRIESSPTVQRSRNLPAKGSEADRVRVHSKQLIPPRVKVRRPLLKIKGLPSVRVKAMNPKQTALAMLHAVVHRRQLDAWGPLLDSLRDAGIPDHDVDYLQDNSSTNKPRVLNNIHSELSGREQYEPYEVHRSEHFRVMHHPYAFEHSMFVPYTIRPTEAVPSSHPHSTLIRSAETLPSAIQRVEQLEQEHQGEQGSKALPNPGEVVPKPKAPTTHPEPLTESQPKPPELPVQKRPEQPTPKQPTVPPKSPSLSLEAKQELHYAAEQVFKGVHTPEHVQKIKEALPHLTHDELQEVKQKLGLSHQVPGPEAPTLKEPHSSAQKPVPAEETAQTEDTQHLPSVEELEQGENVPLPPRSEIYPRDVSRVRVKGKDFFVKGYGQVEYRRKYSPHIEQATSEVANLFGVPTPRTKAIEIGGHPKAVTEWVEGRDIIGNPHAARLLGAEPAIATAHVLLDYLLGNRDTNPGNYMLTNDNRIVGIDKEYSFIYGPSSIDDLINRPHALARLWSIGTGGQGQNSLQLPIVNRPAKNLLSRGREPVEHLLRTGKRGEARGVLYRLGILKDFLARGSGNYGQLLQYTKQGGEPEWGPTQDQPAD